MKLPFDFLACSREFDQAVKANGWELARAWLLATEKYSEDARTLTMQRAARRNTAELVIDIDADIIGNRPVKGAMGA